jgi:hypothetical protein
LGGGSLLKLGLEWDPPKLKAKQKELKTETKNGNYI